MKRAWRIWAKTLGYKISDNDTEANIGAGIRTVWILVNLVTCTAIIANVVRHW